MILKSGFIRRIAENPSEAHYDPRLYQSYLLTQESYAFIFLLRLPDRGYEGRTAFPECSLYTFSLYRSRPRTDIYRGVFPPRRQTGSLRRDPPFSPGASPTNISSAFSLPIPNTVFVFVSQRRDTHRTFRRTLYFFKICVFHILLRIPYFFPSASSGENSALLRFLTKTQSPSP